MDRDSIEAKDQRLMKQFRSLVEQKKQAPAPVDIPGRRQRLLVTGLVVVVLIALPAWFVLRDNPGKSASPVEEEVAIQDVPVIQDPVPEKEETLAAADPEPLEPDPLPENTLSVEESLTDVPPEPAQALDVEAASMDSPTPVPGMRIADIQTCRAVVDRECVSPTDSFSLGGKVRPTVWMTVRAETPPFTLTHAYYVNDRPYCTVPLTIGYPRTRTWSRITVNLETQLGHWRVDVVDDEGQILDSVSFDVVP